MQNSDRNQSESASMTDGDLIDYQTALLRTYRYLRLGIVVLVFMLGAAILKDRLSTGHLLDSISAYYFSDVHPVMIASTCATGACLVMYRGLSDVEDLLLNLAGFLAFIVAFVPTTCTTEPKYCPVDTAMVLANMWALLAAAGLALILGFLISVCGIWPGSSLIGTLNRKGKWMFWFVVTAYLLVVAAVWLAPQWFVRWGHFIAAIGVFGCMITVVIRHGLWLNQRNHDDDGGHRGLQWFYWITSVIMVIGAVILGAMVLQPQPPLPHPAFWLEAWLLGSFEIFWLTQTFTEVWDTAPTR